MCGTYALRTRAVFVTRVTCTIICENQLDRYVMCDEIRENGGGLGMNQGFTGLNQALSFCGEWCTI